MVKRKRGWLAALLVAAACMLPANKTLAASAALELNSVPEEIRKGEEFEVELLVSADVTLGDLEGYITYDEELFTYITGPSCIAGGGGMLKIADIGASQTNQTRRYLLRFLAQQTGSGSIQLYDTPMVYAYETGLAMSVSSNVLTIEVLPAVDASDNANLSALRVNPGQLSPAFATTVNEYEVTIPYEEESIVVSALTEDEHALVRVENNTGLQVGRNEVIITVTAENGTKRSYRIYVTREEKIPEPTPSLEPEKQEEVSLPEYGVQAEEAEDGTVYLYSYAQFQVPKEQEGIPAPTGYEETWLYLDGVRLKAYTKRDEPESDFFVLLLEDENKEAAFYRYDRKDQTIQRFAEEELVIREVLAEDNSVLYETIEKYRSRQYLLLLLTALFLSTTVMAGIFCIRLLLKGKENDGELGE